MAHNFQKIYAPFGRKNLNDRLVDTSIYSRNWVETFYVNNIPMLASEKIDGTSVGLKWDGERISFVGHTEKSQFAPHYLEYLNNRFGTKEFESCIEEIFEDKPVTLYGEGISKDYNVHYGYPDGEFIFYDVQLANGKFMNRKALGDIAEKLGLKMPYTECFTIQQAIDFVKQRPMSKLDPSVRMEGLVLRPLIELYTNNDERIICKVKVKDFVDGIKDYRTE